MLMRMDCYSYSKLCHDSATTLQSLRELMETFALWRSGMEEGFESYMDENARRVCRAKPVRVRSKWKWRIWCMW